MPSGGPHRIKPAELISPPRYARRSLPLDDKMQLSETKARRGRRRVASTTAAAVATVSQHPRW